jgi:hypothetical protein
MKIFTMLFVLALAAMPALPQSEISTVVFRALLSPSHETPPITGTRIQGEGLVEMTLTFAPPGSITSAIIDFRVQYDTEVAQTFTAMHIHRGAAGVAGPVVLDSMFGTSVAAAVGSGALFRSNTFTDPMALAEIEGVLRDPSGYYLNLHSTTNPAGIIRGQLSPDPIFAGSLALQGLESQLESLDSMVRSIGRALGLIFPAPENGGSSGGGSSGGSTTQ